MRAPLAEGAQVGRYVLLTRLAQGGMANVWLARATGAEGFQKTVVIKTILPHLADDPEFVRMFVNEAVVAAQLEHPNIVHIFDLGEADGHHYIAMEHISGRTLRHIQRELRRTKRVPPPWLVLQVVSSVCDALHHAHGKADHRGQPLGLVHRDISPENIMVAFTGETKVLDFGIAKATTASKTRVGVLKGKYAYMAPEQIEGAMEGIAPTSSIDIYSLGVVMYELITGRRPFRGSNDLALMHQILTHEPISPASFCSWVSPALSDLILRAMARDPEERFHSALALRSAVDDYFATIRSQPTPRHVAEYVKSLFGDAAPDALASSIPTPTGGSGLHEAVDPWEVEQTGGQQAHDSLKIDLSMVLLSEEDTVPESKSEPSSRGTRRSRSTFPPSSLALPPMNWDPAMTEMASAGQLTAEDIRAEESSGEPSELDDLPDWGPPSLRGVDLDLSTGSPAPIPDIPPPRAARGAVVASDMETPRPTTAATTLQPEVTATGGTGEDGMAARAVAESEAPHAQRAVGRHFWDLATQKAREQRQAEETAPPPMVEEGEAGARESVTREGYSWDAVVDRIRKEEAGDRSRPGGAERRRGIAAEVRATTLFEQGLEKMRSKDLDGALACWTRALELEPDNRLYQSNLRVLKRQLAERAKSG